MREGSLRGRCIWLTRPAGQAEALCDALQARGARALHLPMLDIRPLPLDPAGRARVQELDRYDFLVFISTNAVTLGLEQIETWWPQMPVGQRYLSVGPSTAAALEARGLPALFPSVGMDSEALLALPELADLSGKRVLLVKGRGGRELLATEMARRGAQVDSLLVYERCRPAYEADFLRACLREQAPEAVVITSAEGLENFHALFTPLGGASALRLFLPSLRVADIARDLAYSDCVVMGGSSDAVILDQLEETFAARCG